MKVAASPRSRAQVAAVLAFVISHTTFLTAQDDETGRCPKVCEKALPALQPSPLGEGKEKAALPSKKEANPASLRSAAPSYGRSCPEGAEVGWGIGMKKSGEIVSSASFTRAPERREYIWGDARRSAESRFPVYAFLT